MKAAVVKDFTKPPVYEEFEQPKPTAETPLVRVKAAGLHQLVKARASGNHYTSTGELPLVPGVDGVGTLEDGTRVYFAPALPLVGTLAEYTLADPTLMFPLPAGIDDVTAAGIANPAMSSWVALSSRAKFQPGESVMILGATGSSGLVAVQTARRRGAKRVIAVGRNPEALEEAKRLGADATIALGEEEQAKAALREQLTEGVNVVLDYLWGNAAELFFEAFAFKGKHLYHRTRYVNIGSMAGAEIELSAALLRSSQLELLGSGFGSASLAEISVALQEFFAEAAARPYTFTARAVPLSNVEQAWTEKSEGRTVFTL